LSLDAERGLLYMPLAREQRLLGGLASGFQSVRDSVVCLDAATGVRKWHFQTVHHGLWITTSGSADAGDDQCGWQKDRCRVAAHQQGFAFVFDRVTGKPVWPIEERPVPVSDVRERNPGRRSPSPPNRRHLLRREFARRCQRFDTAIKEESLAEMKKLLLGRCSLRPAWGNADPPQYHRGADWSGGGFDPETGIVYLKVNANGISCGRHCGQDGHVEPVSNAAGGGRYNIHGNIPCQTALCFPERAGPESRTLVYRKPFATMRGCARTPHWLAYTAGQAGTWHLGADRYQRRSAVRGVVRPRRPPTAITHTACAML